MNEQRCSILAVVRGRGFANLLMNGSTTMRQFSIKRAVLAVLVLLALTGPVSAQALKSPEQYFGHKMGADRKLVAWPQILAYFKALEAGSNKLKIVEMGKSSMGNSMIVAIISSPQNLANLDKYKQISQRLANPRGLSPDEASKLIAEGKVIASISCSIHATEIAASQLSSELAYDLVTKDTPQIRDILDRTIILLAPSHNPDGNIMVVDWYNKNVGTPFENAPMPWLYHKYVGHDNNRDWFMLNLQETRVVSQFYFREWFPQMLYDIHQMGRNGARLFVPPFLDPMNPNVHPLVWRENNLIGTNMYRALEEDGRTGVADSISYTSWWQGTSLMQPWWHNMASVLTEGASVNVASPVLQKVEELTGNRPGLLEYKLAKNFTHPWPGGWWRLRDLVEYEYDAAMSFLDTASKYHDNFLRNFYTMGRDAIEKGKTESPFAFVVPANQHDPNAAVKMLNILMWQGAEVHQATADFTADGVTYPKGSWVLLLSQPFRPFVKDIMETQVYPDMRWFPGGPPIPPYDVAGYTLPMQMGVTSVTVAKPFEASLTSIQKAELPPAKVDGAGATYIIGHETNDSLIAVNRLLKGGADVFWSEQAFTAGGQNYPAGTIVVSGKGPVQAQVAAVAKDLSLPVRAVPGVTGSGYKLKPIRVALYNPWGGSMDEGWCRWLLEQYEFPFTEVRNADIKAGSLKSKFDVVLLADQAMDGIIKGIDASRIPAEYAGGIGDQGVVALKEFVNAGGTLVTVGASGALPIKQFGLPVRDTLEGVKEDVFFCPGSILAIDVDANHPAAFGMEARANAFFVRNSAYEITPSFGQNQPRIIVKYAEKDVLKSGWILGEKLLNNKAAVVDVPVGKGHVVLLGFKAQQRAEPHGTFKLLFNSLYFGSATMTKMGAASGKPGHQ